MRTLETNCPFCGSPLLSAPGDQMDELNGVTVWCGKENCMDSGGHGKNEATALNIFLQKCKVDTDKPDNNTTKKKK